MPNFVLVHVEVRQQLVWVFDAMRKKGVVTASLKKWYQTIVSIIAPERDNRQRDVASRLPPTAFLLATRD